ncbi:hypothetical protein [Halarchaeum nitratireducens]|uniref:hypothetical protein n=1 Tax=Halarchaeum nitratireducens TaxID=489913 RepID=UPI00166CB485|nr:hypothetical protein [Halarchaeum nitratireducens]
MQYTGAGVEPNADAPRRSGGIYDLIKEFYRHSPLAAVRLIVRVGEVSPILAQTFLSIRSIKIRRERGIFPAFFAIVLPPGIISSRELYSIQMTSHITSTWSLRTKPSWWEIALAVLIGAEALVNFAGDNEIAWFWFMIGSAMFGLAAGPGAASDVGQQIGTWFKSIGVAGRLLAIIGFAVMMWATTATLPFVRTPLYSLSTGGLLTIAVLVFLKLVVSSLTTEAQSE